MTYLSTDELLDGRATQPAAWTEPTPAEWRARCLLALSLVNHRGTEDGLTALDVEVVRGALMGEWS